MRCKCCPALLQEGYEYPEECCMLGEEGKEFNDGSIGCIRKSKAKIERELKIANELDNNAFAEECGEMVKFFKNGDKNE